MKLLLLLVIGVSALVRAETHPPQDFKLSEYVEIKENDLQTEGRSNDIESSIENYIKRHDAIFKLPSGSTVTLVARNLDNGEVDLKLNFGREEVEGRKKSKLKKVFIPIFVFILIKAMVLIPLALGILAIKTWNALQLSFGSFVVALALGVWQLCKKISGDNAHPPIIAHGGWHDKRFIARNFDSTQAPSLAYSAYAPSSSL